MSKTIHTKLQQMFAIRTLAIIIEDLALTGKKLEETNDDRTYLLCKYMDEYTYGWYAWRDDIEEQIDAILDFQKYILKLPVC